LEYLAQGHTSLSMKKVFQNKNRHKNCCTER
jgi:hypothetical protein